MVSLWGDSATSFTFEVGSVIGIKKAKVSTFG